MLPHIALPEARHTLEPRMSILTSVLRTSVAAYNARPTAWQFSLDKKARALLLNRLWYFQVAQALHNDTGILLVPNHGESYFVIDEALVLRFKHLGGDLLSKNYQTERMRHWNRQLRMEGIPPWNRLEFGYRLDITGTTIRDAFVLLREDKRLLWIWQVMGLPISTFAAQTALPLTSSIQGNSQLFAYSNYSA